MKQTKRILASVLSVILAFSCFAVVPAFAEDLATLETYDKVTGVTLVNQKLPAGYNSPSLTADFSDLAALITARVNPNFGGALNNTLQLSDLDNTFLAGKLSGRTNLLAGVGGTFVTGSGKIANADFKPAAITDGNITTNWYSGDFLGTITNGVSQLGWQPEDGQPIVFGDERAATNSFDYQIAYDLGEEKEIDTFYQFGFVRPIMQNTTYKVYVGNDIDTLYSAENEVFYFNSYDVHKTHQENLSFNAIRNTVYASATNGLPDGQWVEFKGNKKPTGQYVGFRVYDSAYGDDNWALIGEIGVLGQKAPEPAFVTGGNLTHLDTSSATAGVDYATKVAASTIKLNQKYTANIQLSNMVGSAFGAKVAGETNLVKAVRRKGYAGSWGSLDEKGVSDITDMVYYNYNDAGHAGTAWGTGSTLNNISYEAVTKAAGGTIVYGADRIANDYYDALLTLELSGRTAIKKLLYAGHVAMNVASRTYAIYVSDTEEDLYDPENQVFLFNNHGNLDAYRFNGLNDGGTGRGCEGPYLEFTGDTVPTGKYVGFKFYDASNLSAGQISVYDIFVGGTELPDPLTIADSDTVYSGTSAYAEKLAKLNVSGNVNYIATLQLADLTGNTLSSKVAGETNRFVGGEYQEWNKKGTDSWTKLTDAEMTKLTDKEYVGNGSATSAIGSNTMLNASGYNKNTFAAAGDTTELEGTARVLADRYDILLTAELTGVTAIEKLYAVGHPNPALSPVTYAVFVGNDKATLYNKENQVFYFDYSAAAANQEGWKFNGSNGSGNRTAEMQYLEFSGSNLPTGKYVGFKFYDTADHGSYPGAFNLYDIGVYGEVTEYSAKNFVSYSFGTTSTKKVVNVGKSGGATILDAEGNVADTIKIGDTITFKAEPVTDSRHTFLGWYNGDQKVSGELEYTTTFDGTALEAKYSTDLIFLMTPGENVSIVSYYGNSKDKNGNPTGYGLVDWVYDAEEDAMAITGGKKTITVNGDNPETEEVEESYETETTMQAGALINTYTIGGENVYATQYEPWTTYKYTLTLKSNKIVTANAGVHAMNFQNTAVAYNDVVYAEDQYGEYVTYEFYFNSGAADYRNSTTVASVATGWISANLLNIGSIADGQTIYLKEMSIEKVNTLMEGNVSNATVKGYGNRTYKRTNQASISAPTDNNQYGGLTAANAIAALIYDGLAADKVIGAADNGKAMFTVEPDEGYEITAVKVNGEAVTADENGVYTYTGAAIDDGITNAYLRADNKAYVVDVETKLHVHTEETVKGYAATCTTKGLTDGVKCSVCGEILTAQEEIKELGHTEETVKGYPATCTTKGLTDGIVCKVCGETIKAQEEIKELGHDMQLNDEKTAMVCKNGCGEQYAVNYVSFTDKDGKVIYEVILNKGENLSPEAVAAAEALVPEIYGYDFAGWNSATDEPIVAATTFTATYKKQDVTYTITINYINSVEVLENVAYDSKITVYDKYATQWLVDGRVVTIGDRAVLYAAGNMEITASAEEVVNTPFVEIINTQIVAKADSNSYVTFAHVNAADKAIREMGFIYVTGTTHDIVGNDNFTFEGLETASRQYVQAKMPRTGADFMATYDNITNTKYVRRYARAYVIFEDGTVCYSGVVGTSFN